MRSVFVFAAVLAAAAWSTSASLNVRELDCTIGLNPTVTFLTSCTTVSASDASCWTPRPPTETDVVLFPGSTDASIPYEKVFAPFSVASMVLQAGGKIVMKGGAIIVRECLQVEGTLLLNTGENVDNGTISTVTYPVDASVPSGTDCQAVPRGFSPRICGPGKVYVTGVLTLEGMFASLWARADIAASAVVNFNSASFLWGNLSNYGTLNSNAAFYFHGALMNHPGANAQLTQLRPDLWTTEPKTAFATLSIVNYGSMQFTLPKDAAGSFEYVSTKDFVDRNTYATRAIVQLHIENHDSLLFYSWMRSQSWNIISTWGGGAIDLVNFGTTTWRGAQNFDGYGTFANYGSFVADAAGVGLQNYVSHGGTEVVLNGGSFGYGVSEAFEQLLKQRGVKGPYLSTVRIQNSRMVSSDGEGSFASYASVLLQGNLDIMPGAMFANRIRFNVSTLLETKSTGQIAIGGAYVAGTFEQLAPNRVSTHVLRTGSITIPKGSVAELHEGTNLVMDGGALLRIDGRIATRSSSSATQERMLQFNSRTFGSGLMNVAGDFSLDGLLIPLEM